MSHLQNDERWQLFFFLTHLLNEGLILGEKTDLSA